MRISLLSMFSVSLALSACVHDEVLNLGGDAGLGRDAPSTGDLPLNGPDGVDGIDGGFDDVVDDSPFDVSSLLPHIQPPPPSIALGTTGGPATAADGWIVFDSDSVQLVRHIFAIRADGTGLTQITSGMAADYEPAVSADGTTILFASTRTGSVQIFSFDVASKAVTQLTTVGGDEPAFAPDGKTFAFHSGFDVWVANADGSGARKVIVSPGQVFGENYEHPVFTQDGTQLIVDRLNEIDAFDLSGTQVRYVVGNTTADESQPALSREGVNLAFVANPCGSTIGAPDGVIMLTLAATDLPDWCNGRPATFAQLGTLSHPSWGPRTLITFAHVSIAGVRRVVVADAESLTAQPVELLQDSGNQEDPFWAPSTFSPPAP